MNINAASRSQRTSVHRTHCRRRSLFDAVMFMFNHVYYCYYGMAIARREMHHTVCSVSVCTCLGSSTPSFHFPYPKRSLISMQFKCRWILFLPHQIIIRNPSQCRPALTRFESIRWRLWLWWYAIMKNVSFLVVAHANQVGGDFAFEHSFADKAINLNFVHLSGFVCLLCRLLLAGDWRTWITMSSFA